MAKSGDKERGKPQASDDDERQQQAAAAMAKDAPHNAKADTDDDRSKSRDRDRGSDDERRPSADDAKVKAQAEVEKAKAAADKAAAGRDDDNFKSGDHDRGDDERQQQAAAAAAAKAKSEADAKAKVDFEKSNDDRGDKSDSAHDKDNDESKSEKADASKKADGGHDDDVKHFANASKDGDKKSAGDKGDGDKDHDAKSHDGDKRPDDHDGKSQHADHHDSDDDGNGSAPVVTTPAVTPPVATAPEAPPPATTAPEATPPAAVESLVLKAADVSNVGSSATLLGSRTADTLHAATSHDDVYGRGGNDTIHGADSAQATLPILIDGALTNAADANAVTFLVSGMPAGAGLSAGVDNGNGTWSLSKADLAGLSITADAGSDFTLHVTASATDGSGLVENADLHVTMHAGQGNLLSGGSGSDMIYGSVNGDDMIYGGSVVHTGHSSGVADDDVIHVGNGNASVWGQGGNDTIYAGAGKDSIWGGIGDDVVHVGSGSGDFHGGSGFDTLDFSGVASGVTVDLKAKTASGDLSVKGFEAVVGSAHDDSIWGDANANVFTGGAGNDTFGFHKSDLKLGAVDHITDFGAGDQLDLSAIVLGKPQNIFVTESDRGTIVSAKIGGVMHDIVVLDGVHGMTAQDMLAHGAILT